MAGIICLETEWQITKRGNRLTLNSEPLMRFINEMYNIPYIYRRIATLSELKYYLNQFQKKEYDKYKIIYFSFHGDTHSIHLEGEKEDLSLNDLQEIGGNVFQDKFVHFSSCRTLLGSDEISETFKDNSGAKIVSGYTKSVESDLSAIHDVAMFGEFLKHKSVSAVFRNLSKQYEGLEKNLGFKAFYD